MHSVTLLALVIRRCSPVGFGSVYPAARRTEVTLVRVLTYRLRGTRPSVSNFQGQYVDRGSGKMGKGSPEVVEENPVSNTYQERPKSGRASPLGLIDPNVHGRIRGH